MCRIQPKVVAFVWSFCIHAIALAAILWPFPKRGTEIAVRYGDEYSFAVSLTDKTRGPRASPQLPPKDNFLYSVNAPSLQSRSSTLDGDQEFGELELQNSEAFPIVPPQPPLTSASQRESSNVSDLSNTTGDQDSSPGASVVNNTAVLAEIARCLPVGVRPQLALATLTLAVDQSGQLAAAPVVAFSSPVGSKQDAKAADQIVQAALQCGPYLDEDVRGRTLTMAADFSETQPVDAK